MNKQHRNKLMLEHLPMVNSLVASMCHNRGLNDKMFIEDCQSSVVINGLIKAVDTYDDSKNSSLKTWVCIKAKGAMIDHLRRDFPGGRSGRKEIKEHETKSGWTRKMMLNRMLSLNLAFPVDIENLLNSSLLSVNGIEKKVCDKDLCFKIFDYLNNRYDRLPRTRKDTVEIFCLYFIEEYLLNEIAKVKRCTESNISLIITKAIPKIREHFIKK